MESVFIWECPCCGSLHSWERRIEDDVPGIIWLRCPSPLCNRSSMWEIDRLGVLDLYKVGPDAGDFISMSSDADGSWG